MATILYSSIVEEKPLKIVEFISMHGSGRWS
jgi:hypothetical protein